MKEKYLLVIDAQNDFVTGSLGSIAAQETIPRICEKVEGFNGVIIFTRDTHHENYPGTQEGRFLPVEHCLYDTEGWDLIPELDRYQKKHNSTVYDKNTFGNIQLAMDIGRLYDEGKVESVELIGFDTDICVMSNALILKSTIPELPISVDPECCAGSTPEKHDAALKVMESCQIIIG